MGDIQGRPEDHHRLRVLVTVPNLHWINKHVVHKLLLLQHEKRYAVTITMPSNKPLENNQHHIVKDLLEGGYDYWLSIDDENPPTNNPLDLIELDKDIVGFPTPVWHYTRKPGERPIYLNAYSWDEKAGAFREFHPQTGVQRVDAVGGGCFLAHRRVFEHPDMRGCFTRILNDDGTVEFGNDMSFCKRATEAGFEIWAAFDYQDRSYVCDHFVELSLLEIARAIEGLR